MSHARRSSSSSSATPAIGSLPVLALVLSIVGLILGSVVLFIHQELAASQGDYTSFCDISEGVSCDVVLGSVYASFLGIPVGGWALLAYVVAGGLAAWLMRAPPDQRYAAATALLGLAGAILGISIYFFYLSAVVIGVVCPMCLSMDAVNLGLFGCALVLFQQVSRRDSSGFAPAPLLAAAAIGTIAVVGLLALTQDGGPAGPITVDGIKRDDPRFYAYYVSQPIMEPPMGEAHVEEDAPITIVEFSDYECPYCRRAFLDLSGVLAEGNTDVRVVHRNFPLNSDCNPAIQSRVHEMACKAAIASECAARQGKEAPFSYLLFTNQDELSPEELESYAQQAGLDLAAYRACIEAPDAAAAVTRDVEDGIEAGVESTPTLFINGRRIKGGFSRPEQYRYALAIERDRLAREAAGTATP